MNSNPFDRFAAKLYLSEYFGRFDTEDAFLLTFLHEVYGRLPDVPSMLEIGGGPCIYPLISARRRVERITFAEYSPENRHEVEAWCLDAPEAFDWGEHFRFVQMLEDYKQSVEQMEVELRGKFERCVPCDVFSPAPLSGNDLNATRFPLVSVHCCPESITTTKKDFEAVLANILTLIAPGGVLVMTLIAQSSCWTVGQAEFPSFAVAADELQQLLRDYGFVVNTLETSPAAPGRSYHSLIALTATRRMGPLENEVFRRNRRRGQPPAS